MSSNIYKQGTDLSITLIISTFVLQMFFFAPLQVLAQNFGEFSVQFIDVLLSLLLVSIVLIVFLDFVLRLLRFPVLLAILTLLSVIGFLESRVFLAFAQHNPFDGKLIDWDNLQWLSYFELGVFIILGIVFVLIRKRTEVLSAISLFILLFLTVGLLFATYNNFGSLKPDPQANAQASSYLDQFYRLSTKRNVIHIVPDQAQGAMLNEILSSDFERYSSVFDGFTSFTQSVGRYKGTYPSVVYYMTGESPEPDADVVINQAFTWDYIEDTLEQRSIVSLLAQNDFNTFGFQFHPGLYCKGPYTACTGTHDEVFAGITANTPRRKLALTVLTAVDLGLFQMSPVVLRERVYDEGRWSVRRPLTSAVSHSGILDVFTQKIQTGEYPDSYNYFHHAGAHAPVLFDRDCNYLGPQKIDFESESEQVRCTLIQLEKMILALKKAGVYDQTMIVINGDHGTPWLPASLSDRPGEIISEALMGMASTFLFIKPPHARGPMEFSSRLVTMGDIPATIAAALGLDHDFSGVQIFNEDSATVSDRQYFDYDLSSKAHSLQALQNLTRYRIRGKVFDEMGWVLPNSASSENLSPDPGGDSSNIGIYPSQLRMDHAEFERYAEGFSILEQHSVPARWVDGDLAWVLLSPPVEGPVELVFDSLIPSHISGQWMEISVAGRIIARLDEKELGENRHVVLIPEDLRGVEVLEIGFTMGKALSAGQDTRQLSALFWYIALEPSG